MKKLDHIITKQCQFHYVHPTTGAEAEIGGPFNKQTKNVFRLFVVLTKDFAINFSCELKPVLGVFFTPLIYNFAKYSDKTVYWVFKYLSI